MSANPSRRLRRAARRPRAGFSLIEMMAVIVIILILMAFLIPRLGTMKETVIANSTRAFMEGQLRAAIGEVENELGDAPPSSWNEAWGPEPNDTNRGSECLYVSLWSPEMPKTNLDEEKRLGNTDGDQLKKKATIIEARDLFELVDDWGNPIAYFHHRDYGRADTYVTIANETGVEETAVVKAQQSPKTKGYYNPRGYQLVSAGEDGIFNTGDDITNFEHE